MAWLDIWTGIWDETWGIFVEPIGAGDSLYYNTLIEVYDDTDTDTLLDILHARMDPTSLSELRAHGAGSFKVSKSDAKILENPSLIEYRKYVKVRLNGSVVGGFIIQTKRTVIVGAGEESDEMWEVSGEGPRSWVRDASVYPARGLKARSSDTRYFNFATEQGSWYNPAQWTNAVVCWNWNQAGNWYGTAPSEWPDAPNAKWIWDRSGPFQMPQGFVYFRREFTVPSDASYSMFVACDDQAEVFVDGELLHTTTYNAWQDTNRIDFDLTTGSHVIGIRAYNYRPDGPGGVLAALFKYGNPLVPTSAELVLVSDTQWKIQAYPSVEPGWSMGDVLLTLLDEAADRGIRFAQNWTPTFSAALDSSGESWGTPVPWSFTVGATYEDVIESIEEMGCDIWVNPDTLEINAWKKRGVDRSITSEAAPWVEERRNLLNNPLGSQAADVTGWTAANNATVSFDSTLRGARVTCAAGGATDSGVNFSSGITYTTGVEVYTVSADVYGEVTDGWRVSVQGTWGTVNGPYVNVPAGEVRRISLTFSTSAGARGAIYFLRQTAGVASQAVIKNVTFEKSSIELPFFDGDTLVTDPRYRYRWLGLQNASSSVMDSKVSENAIVLIPGFNLLSAEETGQAEIANTLMLHAQDGWTEETYTDTTSLTKYGRVETQLSTQLSASGADPLVQEVFRTKALPEKSATFEIIPVDGMIPFIDFNVGDILSAPSDVPGVYESRRVMSISFTEDGATGKPQFSVEFDNIFKDRQSELEKWVSRISNSSAIGGGFSNSATLPPTATQGQPGSALGSIPDAPTGLIVSSVGHFAEDGTSSSDYSLSWTPVVTGTGFGSVTITEYEVWGRRTTETESQLMAVVFDAFAYMSGFRSGDEWAFKVRAVSRTGGPGPFSSEVGLTAANPVISLGAPSAPDLSTGMGTVTIDWDGLLAGNPAPGYVRYLRVERTSAGSTGTWLEKRRNVFADPRAKALTRFSSTGGATTALSLRTDMIAPTTTAVRSTRNGTGAARLVDFITGTAMLANTSYRTRARVRSSHALTNVSVQYRPAVATAGVAVVADTFDIPVGESYIDVTATTHVNAPTTTTGVTLTHTGTVIGATLDVTDILIEKMPSDGTMVAGDISSADPTKRYRWLGTVDNSISVYEENDPWVPVGTLLRGSTLDASVTVGKSYDYRLVAVDTYGGESAPSAVSSITVEGVQSGDITGGLASQNLVANGSFEEGMTGWEILSIYPNGGAAAEVITTGGIAGAKYLRLTRGVEISGAEINTIVGQSVDNYIPISSVGSYGYFVSGKVAGPSTVTDAVAIYTRWFQGDRVTPASVASSIVVDFEDVSTTAKYLVGQVFPPTDARFMQVTILHGTENSQVYVDDIVAREVISEGMIGQGAITAPHLSAGSVTANALQAGSVTADAIAAGSILADKIAAGAITTNHLSSEVGASLDISSNSAINLIVNRQDSMEDDVAGAVEGVENLQTYYSFGPEGAIIGQTDSAFKLYLKNDRIEILENGVIVSYWDAGQMVVDRFVGNEVILANHKFETYGTGTVVKKI